MKCTRCNHALIISTRLVVESIVLVAAVTLLAGFASPALASTIAETPWNSSNLKMLRSLDKGAIAQFINDDTTYSPLALTGKDIGQFTLKNLEGGSQYQLLVTVDVNARQFFNALLIFQRSSSGAISYQMIHLDGWGIKDLNSAVKDLNGDGKDEIVVPLLLISYSTADTFTWPAVYRLQGNDYVEASRDFGSYYEKEIIPGLEKEISEPNLSPVAGLNLEETKAILQMEKARILRVIGRDPTAGLEDAYQWMNSGDPRLLQDSAATLQNIGGHPKELAAARDSYERALARERAAAH